MQNEPDDRDAASHISAAGDDAAPIPAEAIRERAYDLWERNHRPDGYEAEFWLMAERELRAERRRGAGRR